MSKTRIPPHDIDAEMNILGGILKSKEALNEAVISLEPEKFYSVPHQLIFKAILNLHKDNQTVDMVTVANELQRRKNLQKVNGRAYLAELSECGLSQDIEEHCRIVNQKYHLRETITAFETGVRKCYDDDKTAEKIIDEVESIVMGLSQSGSSDSIHHVREIIPDNLDDLEKTITGEKTYLHTGFDVLDNKIVGLTPSDLIILAARPAMGKSALAMNIAENMAKKGHPVGVFSLEMSKEQLTKRIQYGMAKVSGKMADLGKVTKDEIDRITHSSNELAKLPIYIDDTPVLTPNKLRSKARRMASRHKIECIIVDYIQLMSGSGDNRNQELGDISRSLKILAKELNIPVLALSQLSRACETRNDKRPLMSDLRESGEIEQNADEILFIYREVEYLRHLPEKDPKRQAVENDAEILVRKNRDGETGKVNLSFVKEYARFENISYKETPNDINSPF